MSRTRKFFPFFFLAGMAAAQSDTAGVLTRFFDAVRDSLAKLPECMCVETIERHYYVTKLSHPARNCDDLAAEKRRKNYKPVLETVDRVRLEVSTHGGQEIFSWPGRQSFDRREVWEVIADGPAASGQFAAILEAMVRGDAIDYVFREATEIDGHRAWRYTFEAPADRSHNYIYLGNRPMATGWDGALWIDPASAHPIRLTTRTSELPPPFFACEVTTDADYQDLDIGGRTVILPKEGHDRFSSKTGDEVENKVTFSGCRELAKKTAGTTAETPASPLPDVDLPKDLPVHISLTSRIDSTTAAEGDRFTGKLASPIQDKQRRTLLPAGTPVTGRLRRVAFHLDPAEVGIILHADTVEVDGQLFRIHLKGYSPENTIGCWIYYRRRSTAVAALSGTGIGGLRMERHPPGKRRNECASF